MAENDVQDNDYVSRTGQKDHVPVQDDNAPVEDPIDEAEADTDKALGTVAAHKIYVRLLIFMQKKTSRTPLTSPTL